VGARFSAPVQTGPGAHPASCAMGTGSFLGVKCDRGVTLTPHPLLVPRSSKSRAILLLPLWAVRLVQSLSACTRVQTLSLSLSLSVHDLCYSANVIRLIKSRTVKWAGFTCHVWGEEFWLGEKQKRHKHFGDLAFTSAQR